MTIQQVGEIVRLDQWCMLEMQYQYKRRIIQQSPLGLFVRLEKAAAKLQKICRKYLS